MMRFVVVVAVSWSAVACAASASSTQTTPSSATLDRVKCDAQTVRLEALLLDPKLVEGVEGLYTYGGGGKIGPMGRLRGARMRLSPSCNLASTQIDRVLECHSARVLTGDPTVAAIQDDPYGLRGVPVDIEVTGDRDELVVNIAVDDLDKANVVLERAKRFASSAERGPSLCAQGAAGR